MIVKEKYAPLKIHADFTNKNNQMLSLPGGASRQGVQISLDFLTLALIKN